VDFGKIKMMKKRYLTIDSTMVRTKEKNEKNVIKVRRTK
jgi:hypothetical protein